MIKFNQENIKISHSENLRVPVYLVKESIEKQGGS